MNGSSAHLKDEVSLHVRTCTPLFCISETIRAIGLKFCVQPGTPWLIMAYTSEARCRCTCARADPFFISEKLSI